MGQRRVLRVQGQTYSLAAEAPFESEAALHSAIAEHPEVLPADELGLGPLVNVAVELDLGAGPMDLLAVDGSGRTVVVEFKRGSENPDVRKVIAQLLDYGSALWRTTLDRLEEACARVAPDWGGGVTDHVGAQLERLGEPFDGEVFRAGLEATLESGDFVFLYVARDLDLRTRRIMTYLGEGPRLSVFLLRSTTTVSDRPTLSWSLGSPSFPTGLPNMASAGRVVLGGKSRNCLRPLRPKSTRWMSDCRAWHGTLAGLLRTPTRRATIDLPREVAREGSGVVGHGL